MKKTAFDRLTGSVKRKLIKKHEQIVLMRKYPKDYLNYWFRKKSKIYDMLHNNGIVNIKPIHKHIWKIWYGTYYYSGVLDSTNEKVFIKIMGEYLENCYNNEVTVNQFIEANSQILYERLPAIKCNSYENGMYFIAYDFLLLEPISLVRDYKDQLRIMIEEFNRIGIIHTDFDLTNIGHINGKLYIFDYGTSLCPISNRVGIRNSEKYNHLEAMPNEAKELVHNPVFYYDDLMHLLHEKMLV